MFQAALCDRRGRRGLKSRLTARPYGSGQAAGAMKAIAQNNEAGTCPAYKIGEGDSPAWLQGLSFLFYKIVAIICHSTVFV